MTAVGVIGLGNIGGAVAANLVADGHDVTVFDLSTERAEAIEGATVARSAREVGAAAAVTFTSLPTSAVVASLAGEWSSATDPGDVLVDLSTGDPAANRSLARFLGQSGRHLVEAPLTGGAAGAAARRLVFMVGGEDEPVATVRPLLESLGRAVFHLGPVGTGSTMKLVNSLVAFAATWSSLEGLQLAAAAGIDLRDAVTIVRTVGASNFYVDRAVESIGTRGQPAQFALVLARKDADLVAAAAADHDIPLPLAAAIADVLADAVDRGLGENDWGDLVVAAEQRSGRTLSLRPEP